MGELTPFSERISLMETPLEPLETKLARLIEQWKDAQAKRIVAKNHMADFGIIEEQNDTSFQLAEFVACHPELLKPTQDLPLVDTLLSLPILIRDAQERFDKIDLEYQRTLTTCSIVFLEQPIFRDKDDKPRQATNERERELALNYGLMNDEGIKVLIRERADALRELQCTKARFEVAKLMVQLVCRGNGK